MKNVQKRRSIVLVLILFIFFGCANEQKDQVISPDNVSIVYTVQGKGSPTLVFVHGWCCDRTYWRLQVDYFAKHFEVVTIDLAGHGESGLNRSAWTIEAFGKDVSTVIKKLNLEDVILIGHSMGGPVIIEAARQMPKPVLGLVGVDTFQNFEFKYSPEQFDKFISPFKANFKEATSRFVRSMFHSNADSTLVESIVKDMSSAPEEVGIGAMKGLFDFDPTKALTETRVPIHCINSDKYPTHVGIGRRHAQSFQVKLMPGIGHFVMLEDPERFDQLLVEAIYEVQKKR